MTPALDTLDDRYVDTKWAAAFLGVKVGTMENWRYAGRGPNYVTFSKNCIRYQVKDLKDHAEALKAYA